MGLAWFKHEMTECSDVVTIMACTGEKEWLVKQEKKFYIVLSFPLLRV